MNFLWPFAGERVLVGPVPICQKGAQLGSWTNNLKVSLELQRKTSTFDKIELKTQHLLSELANSIHFLWPCWWLFWHLDECRILFHGFLGEYNCKLQELRTLAEDEWMTFCIVCLCGVRITSLFSKIGEQEPNPQAMFCVGNTQWRDLSKCRIYPPWWLFGLCLD